MTVEIDRRSMLAGFSAAAAAAAAFQLPGSANAAAPLLGTQNAGWYRYKVGTYEITVVTDGANRFKFPDGFVSNRKREELNAELAALGLQPAPDMITIPYCPVVVNTGSKLVVIDTGTGEANFTNTKGAAGQYLRNLKASGIDAAQVDTVIISHFHGDHINGLLNAQGQRAFPNAEILVPAVEWKYFMDDGEMSRQTTPRMKGVFAGARKVFDALQRKVTPYEAGKEIAPGITAVATHGHSPGHMSHVVASGNDKLFVQADVTNIPVFVRNPGWHLMFDQDPAMAEATRRKTYDMLAADKMLVQGFHYPFPAVARLEKTATGYRETLLPWNSAL